MRLVLLLVSIPLTLSSACLQRETETAGHEAKSRRPAPLEIVVACHELLDDLDAERPGWSAHRLEEFLAENGFYDVTDTIASEIDYYRSLTMGRYHEARELAREGRFDDAQPMLEDLALGQLSTPGLEAASVERGGSGEDERRSATPTESAGEDETDLDTLPPGQLISKTHAYLATDLLVQLAD